MKFFGLVLYSIALNLAASYNGIAQSEDKIHVAARAARDTISLDTMNFIWFNIRIRNIDDAPFKLKTDYLICGYPDDDSYSEYYLELYKTSGMEQVKCSDFYEHYPIVEYYGDYSEIKKGEEIFYKHNSSRLYPFRTPGTYMFWIIFYNEAAFLGKSNWVKITVLPSEKGKSQLH